MAELLRGVLLEMLRDVAVLWALQRGAEDDTLDIALYSLARSPLSPLTIAALWEDDAEVASTGPEFFSFGMGVMISFIYLRVHHQSSTSFR